MTVAQAAPCMPQSNTKIKIGSSTVLIMAPSIMFCMAFLGCPDARKILFMPKYKAVKIPPGIIIIIYSRAYCSVLSVPPNNRKISSINIIDRRMAVPDIMNVSVMAFPSIFSALSLLFSPSVMEMREAEPAPMSIPKAMSTMLNGMVSASPEMANAPTPCPIKIRSTML